MNIVGTDGLVDRLPVVGWKIRGLPLWALAGSAVTIAALVPAGMAVVLLMWAAERSNL